MDDEWEASNPNYTYLPDYTTAGGDNVPSSLSQNPAQSGGGAQQSIGGLGQIFSGLGNSSVTGLLSGASGLYDLFSNGPNSANGINAAAAQAADPFASQRGQYQGQLQNMMTNPSGFQPSDPSYQFRLQQGQQALERSQAAQGYLGSGNMLTALQQYGQGMASQEYGNEFNRLALLSGAQSGSPAAAGQILAGRYQQRNNAMANIGGALGMGQGGTGAGGGSGAAGGGTAGSTLNGLSSLIGTGKTVYSGLQNLFGGGSAAGGAAGATTQAGSELGSGTGGAFDQWASGQQGLDAGSGSSSFGTAGGDASSVAGLGASGGGLGYSGMSDAGANAFANAEWGAEAGTAVGEGTAAGTGAAAGTAEAGAGAEAGAASSAGSVGLAAWPAGIAALAMYFGQKNEARDTKNMFEGASRTADRMKAAGVPASALQQLFTMNNDWTGMTPEQINAKIGNSTNIDPNVSINQDYANQLFSQYPQLAQNGVDMHDLSGDFNQVYGQLYGANSSKIQSAQTALQKWHDTYRHEDIQGGGG